MNTTNINLLRLRGWRVGDIKFLANGDRFGCEVCQHPRTAQFTLIHARHETMEVCDRCLPTNHRKIAAEVETLHTFPCDSDVSPSFFEIFVAAKVFSKENSQQYQRAVEAENEVDPVQWSFHHRMLEHMDCNRPRCHCEGNPLAKLYQNSKTLGLFYACGGFGDPSQSVCRFHGPFRPSYPEQYTALDDFVVD